MSSYLHDLVDDIMQWLYDACGTYCIYKSYLIINQEHPKLDKYAIYKEAKDLSLVFIETASTMVLSKELINNLIKNGSKNGRTIEICTGSNSQVSQTT